jgi:hypothetical protein
MNLAEFKAWLDGFKEAVGDAPTPEQWQRILAKAAELAPHSYESIRQPLEIDPVGWRPSTRPFWDDPVIGVASLTPPLGSYSTQAVVNGHPVGPSD